jgi:hypothetical protein
MAQGRPAWPSDFCASDAFFENLGLKTGMPILCRLQQTTLTARPRGLVRPINQFALTLFDDPMASCNLMVGDFFEHAVHRVPLINFG